MMDSKTSECSFNLNDVEYQDDCDCYLLKNVITDENILMSLAEEVKAMSFSPSVNDLHCLNQTEEFSDLEELPSSVKHFSHQMRTQVRTFVEEIFDIKTHNKMTMTGSLYNKGDYLLCHDDLFSNRCIAFVFYLSKDWAETDGGALRFFDYNEDGPVSGKYLKSFLPLNNSLILFRVSQHSFHEVQEIFGDNTRLSINGWFHGFKPLRGMKREFVKSSFMMFKEFISGNKSSSEIIQLQYLKHHARGDLNTELLKDSVLLAADFLTDDVCKASVNELEKSSRWQLKGSPLHRKYEALEIYQEEGKIVLPKNMPNVKKLVDFFVSDYWQSYLNQVTGLEFAVLRKDCVPPLCLLEVQKWQEGSYSIVTANDMMRRLPTIEVTAFLHVDNDAIQDETPPFSGCLIRLTGRKFSRKSYRRLRSIKMFRAQMEMENKLKWLHDYKLKMALNTEDSTSASKTLCPNKMKRMEDKFYRIEQVIEKKMMRIRHYRKNYAQEHSVLIPKSNSVAIALNSHNTRLFTSYIRHKHFPHKQPRTCVYCINITYMVPSTYDT